ncbi:MULTISPECIES: hypothetical protein [unclassified Rhizobium]|uniref:hypothetical protein n=1 Tax=unclassified Rhizobium TaxID=2613769 RepID=UPI001C82B937|nr:MULTISPECIES: hypothetical protein [unclassified Rhizobium]MBX5163599.1 hypothetical protein [Rhizobium sp. NZLR4b]MBX5208688.1 hypothetical protein [Rhizobium sp. NZLR11]
MRIQFLEFSVALILMGAAIAQPYSGEAADLPEYDSSYCVQLNSKMLDADEKNIETNKCLQEEADTKKKLAEHWEIVSEKAFAYCRTSGPGAYRSLLRCLAGNVGYRCFQDELSCNWN